MNGNSYRVAYYNQVAVLVRNGERGALREQIEGSDWWRTNTERAFVQSFRAARDPWDRRNGDGLQSARHPVGPRCGAETFAQRSGAGIRQSIAAGSPNHRFGQSSPCGPGIFLRPG